MNALQERVWEGRLPLEIRLAASECRTYEQSDPYLVSWLAYEKHHLTRRKKKGIMATPFVAAGQSSCLVTIWSSFLPSEPARLVMSKAYGIVDFSTEALLSTPSPSTAARFLQPFADRRPGHSSGLRWLFRL